ncbi:ABC transporter permease [Parabacteroides bouchesdurhonensis]|uniref:ABC transporter permease n=1 Tax=Parabacteroides bouchesdurhonensis TaxID=1936995 RepID=UPI000C8255C5|nr:ABC transporter permease [Parabacteroides bouchesdurhonensis]
MQTTFKNLLYVLTRYKLATATNLLGLSFAFVLFILIWIHVNHEYSFDTSIPDRERIFQLENMRNDGIWEANFSRPQLERFIAASPGIEAAAVTNNLVYSSVRLGVSTSRDVDGKSYMEQVERITVGYTKVFGFEMVTGNTDCLTHPDGILISESMARKFFGEDNPVGKPLYFSEFGSTEATDIYGLHFEPVYIVGGVYRDFPENTRLKNALYLPIMENEMMEDWNTGPYYCYLLMSSPETVSAMVNQYVTDSKEFLKNFAIEDIRLRPLTDLYFGQQVRADAAPVGDKLRTNMLFFIAILIIGIAMVNYINLSIALAPIRTKSITVQKVLGSSDMTLRKYLVLESLVITVLAFCIALLFVFLLSDIQWVADMLGHQLDLFSNWKILAKTLFIVLVCGILAGIYPAFYITSFPPVMALNKSFTLSDRAKNTRKLLIGFQFVISITLVVGSLFIFLQNKYIGNVDLGFDKDHIMEVRLSVGAALNKSELFKARLLENPDISGVAFSEFKFVSDESRSFIGYNYEGQHSYMSWLGVSSHFPELMNMKMIAGRYFRPSDEAPDNNQPVCILSESAARDIVSHFTSGEINDLSDIVGTNILDNNAPVQIVGIFEDVHYESLYKKMRPLGLWVSAENHYRRTVPERYSYVKIAGGDPRAAIEHIRKVAEELIPGYPVDIHFFDSVLDELYYKSQKQGALVTVLCLLAVFLSMVGVFGLVIFELQGREKEIAVRKIFGSTVRQILWMLNSSFLRITLVCFVISIPIAYYGVNVWLQSFAYKTPVYLWVFVVALLIITLLTSLTVTFQSYRAATANPASKLGH